jgi:hypothetical protein
VAEPPSERPLLVDPAVSAAKLDAQLADWEEAADGYAQRGIRLVRHFDLEVDVAFAAWGGLPLPDGEHQIPVIAVCARLDFTNYDIWAPSVTFIDYFTGQPAPPAVRALAFPGGQVEDVLVDGHGKTGRPFICLPGVREYHIHDWHSGDDWLLHRGTGAGTLAAICEQIWRRMARTVLGVGMESIVARTPDGQFARNLKVGLVQGPPIPPPGVPIPVPLVEA